MLALQGCQTGRPHQVGLLEGWALWGLGGGAGGASPGWQGHRHHCLFLRSKLHCQEVRGGSQAEEAGELEHQGAQDSVEIRVIAPEAHQGMEIAKALRPLPWMGKMTELEKWDGRLTARKI